MNEKEQLVYMYNVCIEEIADGYLNKDKDIESFCRLADVINKKIRNLDIKETMYKKINENVSSSSKAKKL